MQGTPADRGLDYEDVYFDSADGTRLHGWFIPGDGPWILLWCHGSAGNISHRLDGLKRVHDALGTSIFIFDYRGYGLSGGDAPTEIGTYLDTEAAYKYLLKLGASTKRLLIFGNSLGGALAIHLAARRPARAMVLEATFTSIKDCAKKAFLGWLMPWELFLPACDSLSRIPQVKIPLLMVHGEKDSLIPITMGEALFAAANEPKAFHRVPLAGHANVHIIGGDSYYARIGEFISRLGSMDLKGLVSPSREPAPAEPAQQLVVNPALA